MARFQAQFGLNPVSSGNKHTPSVPLFWQTGSILRYFRRYTSRGHSFPYSAASSRDVGHMFQQVSKRHRFVAWRILHSSTARRLGIQVVSRLGLLSPRLKLSLRHRRSVQVGNVLRPVSLRIHHSGPLKIPRPSRFRRACSLAEREGKSSS